MGQQRGEQVLGERVQWHRLRVDGLAQPRGGAALQQQQRLAPEHLPPPDRRSAEVRALNTSTLDNTTLNP